MRHLISELEQRMRIRRIPGVSIRIALGNSEIFEHTLGVSDLTSQIPMTEDHLFRVGCLTKPIIAYAILMLSEQGLVHLDDPISDYIAKLKNTPDYQNVTISHLLCHSSGMVRGDYPLQAQSDNEVLNKIQQSKRLFNAGEDYKYSNWGYFLLGKIIEKVTGVPPEIYLDQAVFKPHRMLNSSLSETSVAHKKLSTGYWKGWRFGCPNLNTPSTVCPYTPLPVSAGGMISNTQDYLNWLKSLVSLSSTYEGRIQKVHKLMLSLQQPKAGKQKARNKFSCFGLFAEIIDDKTFYFFPGSSSGFSGFIFLIPEIKLTGIALCNHGTCNSELKDMLFQICHHLLGDDVPNFGYQLPKLNITAFNQQGDKAELKGDGNSIPKLTLRNHRINLYPHSENCYYLLDQYSQNQMLRISGSKKNKFKLKLGNDEFKQQFNDSVTNNTRLKASGLTESQISDSEQHFKELTGYYHYESFGKVEVILRSNNLYLSYGVVYETLLVPKTPLCFSQKSGPCRYESVQFLQAPDTNEIFAFIMNGMVFRKEPSSRFISSKKMSSNSKVLAISH